jgi:predicted phosphodiesterase
MERYFVFGDSHLEAGIESDPSYKLFKKIVQYQRPEHIVNLGDWFDFSYISRFSEGVAGASEGKRLSKDIELLHKEIQFFKKYTNDFTYLSGNHDDRVMKYLEKNPVMKGLFGIDEVCKEENAKYVPTKLQPYKILDDLYVTHGLTFSKYAAAQMVEKAGVSCIGGHCHRQGSYVHQYADGRILYGATVGTLGSTNPDYVAGQRITGHVNSFAIVYVDDGIWDINQIMVKNNKCIVNGKTYSL